MAIYIFHSLIDIRTPKGLSMDYFCEKPNQSSWLLNNWSLQTAEIPGLHAEGEYDLCGSAVGVVKKDKVIDGKNIVEGDILIGLPSSGFHSNGFSLATR